MFEVKVLSGQGEAQDKAKTGNSFSLQANSIVPFDSDVINRGEAPLILQIIKNGEPVGKISVATSGQLRLEDMLNTLDGSAAVRIVPFCDNLMQVSETTPDIFVGAEEACTGAEKGLFGLFSASSAGFGGAQVASAGAIAGGFIIYDNSMEEEASADGTTLPGSFSGSGSSNAGVRGSAEALSAGLENSTLSALAPLGEATITIADGLVEILTQLTSVLPGVTGADLNSIALAEPNNVGASGVVGVVSALADGLEAAFSETPLDALLKPAFDAIGSSPNNDFSVLTVVEGVGVLLGEDTSPLSIITAQTLSPVIGSRGQPAQSAPMDGAPFFEPGPLF